MVLIKVWIKLKRELYIVSRSYTVHLSGSGLCSQRWNSNGPETVSSLFVYFHVDFIKHPLQVRVTFTLVMTGQHVNRLKRTTHMNVWQNSHLLNNVIYQVVRGRHPANTQSNHRRRLADEVQLRAVSFSSHTSTNRSEHFLLIFQIMWMHHECVCMCRTVCEKGTSRTSTCWNFPLDCWLIITFLSCRSIWCKSVSVLETHVVLWIPCLPLQIV